MTLHNGSAAMDSVRSNILSFVINHAEPSLAMGATVFGLGFLVLPLLARLRPSTPRCAAMSCRDAIFSYEAHEWQSLGSNSGGRLFNRPELRKRFGLVDVAFLAREISMGAGELAEHLRCRDADMIGDESGSIRKWRRQANGRLKLLQKRSALAFLGLPPDAAAGDVNKVYKRMALELHPDKGGDPERFQELQDVKERLVAFDKPDVVDLDDDDTELHPTEDRTAELDEGWEQHVAKQRLEMHESAVHIWDQAGMAKNRVMGDSATPRPQPALNALRNFVSAFVASEVSTLPLGCTPSAAEATLQKFVRKGAEIVAVAAMANVQATLATLAMQLNHPLLGRCGYASEVGSRCAVLLEAVSDVHIKAAELLKELEMSIAMRSDRDEEKKEEPQQTEHPQTPRRNPRARRPGHPRISLAPRRAFGLRRSRVLAMVRSRGATGSLATRTGDEDSPPIFEPPPIRCGAYELRLQMVEDRGGGLEEVQVELWDRDAQVGRISGSYILRMHDSSFSRACHAGPARVMDCALSFFDSSGRLKPPLKEQVSAKACAGGFLYLREIFLVEHVRRRDVGLDFVEGVLQCLSGPMKRLTLVMCTIPAAVGGQACTRALQRHWMRIGFQRAAVDKDIWFLETSALRQRLSKAEVACRDGTRARPRVPSRPAAQPPQPRTLPPLKRAKVAIVESPPPHSLANQVPSKLEVGHADAVVHGNGHPPRRPTLQFADFRETHAIGWSLAAMGNGDANTDHGVVLTPRMHHALVFATSLSSGTLRADAERFISGKRGGPDFWGSEYLPQALQGNVFKAFVKGMAEIVDVIGALLTRNLIPTAAAVSQILSPFARSPGEVLGFRVNKHFVSHFFGSGGKVDHVIRAVVEEAALFYEARESAGEALEGDGGYGFGTYHALPIHMLDGDFDYVRDALLPLPAGGARTAVDGGAGS